MHSFEQAQLYQQFLEFVGVEAQKERNVTSRRLLSVFFWCFLLPALISAALLLLVKLHLIPLGTRKYLDWLALVFPVAYSLYFFSSEVFREMFGAVRRGGLTATLGQAVKEGEWRARICQGMQSSISATPEQWEWITRCFSMDLQGLHYRNRFLTALAGAVFFLLMEGIDTLAGDPQVVLVRDPTLGIVNLSRDYSSFIGLALFLVMLYLSGSQTLRALHRYLNCAELLALKARGERRASA